MKFIADVMLGRLARRLRLLGYDVIYNHSLEDNDVLRLALTQDRIILTRDHGLASRPLAKNHILIESDQIDRQVEQVLSYLPPASAKPLTRCPVCNEPLTPRNKDDVCDIVPGYVLGHTDRFLECMSCGRIFWEGTHVKNMAAFLQKK